MSPVPDWRQQARLGELGEMHAGGLGRNPRRKGKLGGGQGAAIEKRREHRGSRRLPDQRCYFSDERACNHVSNIAPDRCRGGGNTSMPIEANMAAAICAECGIPDWRYRSEAATASPGAGLRTARRPGGRSGDRQRLSGERLDAGELPGSRR